MTSLLLHPRTMTQQLPDLDAFLPNFGWVGKLHICDTFDKTTQHYQANQCVPLWKHFWNCFPGENVWQLPEWYSTDTFFCTIDDGVPRHEGCTIVKICGGLDNKLLLCHPMSSESKLPSTLHDFVHQYRAISLRTNNLNYIASIRIQLSIASRTAKGCFMVSCTMLLAPLIISFFVSSKLLDC